MEIDWGGKFNYTSCGHPMANWQGHETHPTGYKTSEVDWGGHDPNGSDNPPPMSIIKKGNQALQVQSHLEMPVILVQLGHIQRT